MAKLLKILMLEDSEDDAGLVSLALERDDIPFEFKRVETKKDYVHSIDNFQPDVILSDHSLPQFNSIDALKIYNEKELEIPFILVTGSVSEEFAVNIIKQGADDYILKNNLTRLSSAIYSALSKHQAELEKQETFKELEIQNQKLIKINDELDSFVYSLSHNIRSPICSLIGIVNLMEKEFQLNSDIAEYFQMITQSISKLDNTLNDIIEHAHNRNDIVTYSKIDLQKLVKGVVEALQYENKSDLVVLNIEVLEPLHFYSDAYRVTILLRNIISNAIRYSDESKANPVINITIEVKKKNCSIVVEDNGQGIGQTLIPKVFDMFFRANEKSQGAGLGLYVTREIVNRLNGNIELSSIVNEGTRVVVVLPNKILDK